MLEGDRSEIGAGAGDRTDELDYAVALLTSVTIDDLLGIGARGLAVDTELVADRAFRRS